MNWEETRSKYVTSATNFAGRYGYENLSSHIIDVMVSIMMTRDGVFDGGSFVQAICSNDLRAAVSRADSEVLNYLKVMSNTYDYCRIENNGL
jgi:hypothetical protein